MHYLNTTRHLITPPTDATIDELMTLLTERIAPSAATLSGLRSISWMLSHDRMTLQAFSGWESAEDLPRAENSDQHVNNGKIINELLGGLAQPQGHSYYRLLGERSF
ncbi:hypothetical protein [Actinophytocola oryzae]|uniref:Antibiotic biosynthesis monooxygenase n=1 Tax=Actinophytocola oryzae TaxID=502181 RepID=A0A4R7W469_9PSEU|nr:hypothetical protein [Actinophytocola oryzae]TDV56417.1 hypothetical protein CLV71_102484 [Actinophytocola oryzae]